MNKFMTVLLFITTVFHFNNIVADEKHYDDKLKRLFTTIKQRLEIDRLKISNGTSGNMKNSSSTIKVTTKKEKKAENRINVTGLVKKDNGLTLIWIKQNGQLKLTTTRKTDIDKSVITGDPVVIIKVDKNTQNLSIKPGQTWLRDKNKIYDDWQLSAVPATEARQTKPVTSSNPKNHTHQ